MPSYPLYRVREDDKTVLFTANPNNLGPHRLFEGLSQQYEQDQFKICLLRNVYLIYINRAVHEAILSNDASTTTSSSIHKHERTKSKQLELQPCHQPLAKQDVESRLRDLRMAAKVLRSEGGSLRH
jgi:hypothetical protein